LKGDNIMSIFTNNYVETFEGFRARLGEATKTTGINFNAITEWFGRNVRPLVAKMPELTRNQKAAAAVAVVATLALIARSAFAGKKDAQPAAAPSESKASRAAGYLFITVALAAAGIAVRIENVRNRIVAAVSSK